MKKEKLISKFKSTICLLLCTAMVLPFAGCKNDENGLVAHDVETAISQLNELGEESGYKNALAELTEKNTTQVDGDSYYRLQQNYKGIPVYGRTVVYAADEDGNMTSITGNALDVDDSIDLVPTVTQEQVEEAVAAYLTKATDNTDINEEIKSTDAHELEIKEITNDAICIYISPDTYKTHLAYMLDVGGNEYIIDAHNSEIIFENSLITETINTETVIGYVASDTAQEHGFPIEKRGEFYYVMSDLSRKLTVYTFNGRISEDVNAFYRSRATVVESTDPIFGNSEAESNLEYEKGAQLLINASKIHDYFIELGFVPSAQQTNLYYNDGYKNGSNALGGVVDGYGIISMGSETGVNCLDVLAHEYTHFVSREIVGWNGNQENSSLNEAMSDIFGAVIEADISGELDWLISDIRNIADPSIGGYPEKASDSNNSNEEDGHAYSTVISHAAYLMWNGIDGDKSKKLTTDELAQLWYRAMLMMPADSDFVDCRKTVETAALSIEDLNNDQIECVSEAFDAVGIYDATSDPSLCDYHVQNGTKLYVYDNEENPYSGYTLQISGAIAQHEIGSIMLPDIGYRHDSTQVVESKEPYILDLYDGCYRITISDDYSSDIYSFTVYVSEDGIDQDIKLVTSFEEPLVVLIPEELSLSSEDQYEMNVFLSNFSEQWFYEHKTEDFDIDSADIAELIRFVFIHRNINGPNSFWDTVVWDTEDGYGHIYLSIDEVNETLNRFFGISITLNDAQNSGYTVKNNRIYDIYGVGESYNHFTIADSVIDQNDGTYLVSFNIYELDLDRYFADGIGKDYYYLDSDSAKNRTDLSLHLSGKAVVKPYTTTSGRNTYQLISYKLTKSNTDTNDNNSNTTESDTTSSLEGDAIIYTQYLLDGGYDEIFGHEIDKNFLDISTCFVDIDSDDTKELLISLKNTEFSGPHGYETATALLDIHNGSVEIMATGYHGGGTMGGDYLEIIYDKPSKTHILARYGYNNDGVYTSRNYHYTYSSYSYKIQNKMECGHYTKGFNDSEINSIRNATTQYVEDDITLRYWKINDEYVSENDYNNMAESFTTPVDEKYQFKQGTYNNPIS